MAGVKYIKKTKEEVAAAPEKPAAGRKGKAAAEAPKPAANTKAKVTKKPATDGVSKATPEVEPKKRGRPKATEAAAPAKKAAAKPKAKAAPTKTNGETKKKAAPKAKKEASPVEEKPKATRKRKASEEPAEPVAKKPKVVHKGPVINQKPTQILNVYVFGEGSSGELGLGTAKNAIDVKRPRLNANLSAETVGVVQIAAGGMHVAALTKYNKIFTWGVNDQGALGRDTKWDGGLKDMDEAKDDDDDSDDSDDDTGMNPRESTPEQIPTEHFPDDTIFVQVVASDSATFALTDDGQVWGWGTFRSNEGILGFTDKVHIQREPMLIPGLKKITKLACGANHVLALDSTGAVFAWGSGQQNQLGRRVVERTKTQGLVPREFGLPRKAVKDIECGAYHSFAIDNKDRVWSWGLNNFGETGISDDAGEDDAALLKPQQVESLSGKGVTCIKGGSHHSIAVTGNGDCLTWGRIDGNALGYPTSEIPADEIVKDENDKPRILTVPTKVKAITEPVAFATAGPEHNIAITKNGQAWSWGFSANYQTAQGTTDDIVTATLIDNTAVRGKKLDKAYAGGQFGILTGLATQDTKMTNGTHA